MKWRCLGAAICAVLVGHAAAAGDGEHPWDFPDDARLAAGSDEYAWALFVAVNRPVAGGAGPGDGSSTAGADGPVVWETWATAADMFRPDGSDPGPWSSRAATGEPATAARFDFPSRNSFNHPMHIVDGRMQPVADGIAGTERLTEIRLNGVSFDYIRAEELYNLDGQLRHFATREAVVFPRGAIDVKAKWRIIGESERLRYHTLRVSIDGVVRLYGLTALHLASKSRPDWFWATFEQVDNPSLPGNEGWQLPSKDAFACGAERPDCNQAPHGIGLEGTVWQNYRLRGTMTDFVDAANQPLRLANSELERGMQQSSSCITCHSRASIGVADGQPVRLAILDRRDGADMEPRRGYVGLPSADWFAARGADARPLFQSLDFVWSLVKAQARPKLRDSHPPVETGDLP